MNSLTIWNMERGHCASGSTMNQYKRPAKGTSMSKNRRHHSPAGTSGKKCQIQQKCSWAARIFMGAQTLTNAKNKGESQGVSKTYVVFCVWSTLYLGLTPEVRFKNQAFKCDTSFVAAKKTRMAKNLSSSALARMVRATRAPCCAIQPSSWRSASVGPSARALTPSMLAPEMSKTSAKFQRP